MNETALAASSDELVNELALISIEGAAEELERRGLPVPVPYATRRAPDTEEFVTDGDTLTETMPRKNLPTSLLGQLAAEGDEAAATEISYRYPETQNEPHPEG